MGVEHYRIMGASIRDGDNETIVLHIFARFSGRLTQRHFYGKAWLEYEKGTPFMPFHREYVRHFPKVTLQGLETGANFTLQHVTHPDFCVHIEGVFEDNSTAYVMMFDGWRRTQDLRPYDWHSTVRERMPGELREQPQVVAVYSPMDLMSRGIAFTARVFTYNIEYHRRLGYTGFIAYLRPRMIEGVLRSPILRRYVDDGLLLLVYWDEFPMQGWGHYSDQWPSYYHATVALSGEHVLLHFLDLDEYLGSDTPISSIQALMTGCMGEYGDYRLYGQEYRMDASVLRQGKRGWRSEADAWLSTSVTDPLKLYNDQRLLYNPSNGDRVFSKHIASPTALLGFNNHHASIKAAATTTDVHWTCAYIVHLPCLFFNRNDREEWRPTPTWWWLHSNDTIVL